MAWTWQFLGESGESVDAGEDVVTEEFPSQSDAESWLGENWRQLLANGVVEVRLVEDSRVEYTMPLTAE